MNIRRETRLIVQPPRPEQKASHTLHTVSDQNKHAVWTSGLRKQVLLPGDDRAEEVMGRCPPCPSDMLQGCTALTHLGSKKQLFILTI